MDEIIGIIGNLNEIEQIMSESMAFEINLKLN